MLKDLIKKARSYRKFDESAKLNIEKLRDIVSTLRFISSAKNLQPLKYIICTNQEKNKEIFSTLRWAGYLKDWEGPEEGERPTAYVIILKDKMLADDEFVLYDAGIAIQTIMLLLIESGLGGCPIAAINKKELRKILQIDNNKEILCAVAIGKPQEKIVITEPKNGDIKYYRDAKGVHFVPKRRAEELVYKEIK